MIFIEKLNINSHNIFIDFNRRVFREKKFWLANKLATVSTSTAEEVSEEIKSIIHEAASALGTTPKNNKKNIEKTPWWNKNLQQLVNLKKLLHKKRLVTRAQDDIKNYQAKRREVLKELKKAQNDHWEKICSEIDMNLGNKRTTRLGK